MLNWNLWITTWWIFSTNLHLFDVVLDHFDWIAIGILAGNHLLLSDYFGSDDWKDKHIQISIKLEMFPACFTPLHCRWVLSSKYGARWLVLLLLLCLYYRCWELGICIETHEYLISGGSCKECALSLIFRKPVSSLTLAGSLPPARPAALISTLTLPVPHWAADIQIPNAQSKLISLL